MIRVKICGVTDAAAARAAADAGAAYVGFVFFGPSPRNVDPARARDIASSLPSGLAKVALTVDMPDEELDSIVGTVPLDMIQLHGRESPERVTQVKARHGLPVMKAVGVREASDLSAIDAYARLADQVLVDAKPPKGAIRPGGHGAAFDWTLLAGRRWPVPWMLAGGLTPENVAEAIRVTGAQQIDVSSGVERAPGIKDAALIQAFIAEAGIAAPV